MILWTIAMAGVALIFWVVAVAARMETKNVRKTLATAKRDLAKCEKDRDHFDRLREHDDYLRRHRDKLLLERNDYKVLARDYGNRLDLVDADLAGCIETFVDIRDDRIANPEGAARYRLSSINTLVECESCHGEMSETCWKCRGADSPEFPCDVCHGQHSVPCGDCEGRGKC